MNKNLLKLIVACGTACFLACAAPQKTETEKWSERMARSEMKRFPEPWKTTLGIYPRTSSEIHVGRMETYRGQRIL